MTPTLNREEIDDLKARVDLVALFEEHGVDVRKFGRGFKARCPFHEEKSPSMSLDPKKGVYHCFGCGQSGDHLTFLQEHTKRSFGEAVAELHRLARTTPVRANLTWPR
jgi:DNA primase